MAKEKNKLDQFFKEKLENHTEKPSALAWKRLEAQLPQQSKSYKGIWWAVAASLTVLFAVGYLVMREGNVAEDQKPLLSENTTEETIQTPTPKDFTSPEIIEETQTNVENQQPAKDLNTKPTITPDAKPADSFSNTPKAQPKTPQNLIATRDQREEITPKTVNEFVPAITVDIPTIAEPVLPALDLEKTVAVASPTEEADPTYTVKIYSDGLKETQKDKNIIAGIGKTVTEVEELLGKVDQGFADLQDAKNNLFASITTKKSKAEE
ncbi:hypothetical protein [Algoriphagus sp.]|uniref:hypothetical protein n=1 Tax=Algoriphagus sp. TaxID=1872435 RepID=UPI003273D437